MSTAEAIAAFADEGLAPESWSNGPGAIYPSHEHPWAKVLYCIAGSITFHTPDGAVSLAPGDRLDLPAFTPHTAVVGPEGVTCWEAYRR